MYNQLKAKVAELTKSEERLRYQVLHLIRALEARAEAARRAVEMVGGASSESPSSSTAPGRKEALREKLASVLLGNYYLSEQEEKKKKKAVS